MSALMCTASEEVIVRRNAIRSSWSASERKQRAIAANADQYELAVLLGLVPGMSANTDAEKAGERRFRA